MTLLCWKHFQSSTGTLRHLWGVLDCLVYFPSNTHLSSLSTSMVLFLKTFQVMKYSTTTRKLHFSLDLLTWKKCCPSLFKNWGTPVRSSALCVSADRILCCAHVVKVYSCELAAAVENASSPLLQILRFSFKWRRSFEVLDRNKNVVKLRHSGKMIQHSLLHKCAECTISDPTSPCRGVVYYFLI